MKKYYLQTTWQNAQLFLIAGFLYPEKLHNSLFHNNKYGEDFTDFNNDIVCKLGNYLPLYDKIIIDEYYNKDETVIFELNDLDQKNITSSEFKISLYNGVIPITYIKKIYIKSLNHYKSYIHMDAKDIGMYIQKTVNDLPNIETDDSFDSSNIKLVENKNIETIKKDLLQKNIDLGGIRFLKYIFQKEKKDCLLYKIYFSKEDTDLEKIYKYKGKLNKKDINEIILNHIKENNDLKLANLISLLKEFKKPLKEIEYIIRNLEEFEKESLNAPTYDGLFSFDLNENYGIFIFILLFKLKSLNDFLNKLYSDKFNINFDVKIFAIYIFGTKYTYLKLPFKLDNIYLKPNIEDNKNNGIDIIVDDIYLGEKDVYNTIVLFTELINQQKEKLDKEKDEVLKQQKEKSDKEKDEALKQQKEKSDKEKDEALKQQKEKSDKEKDEALKQQKEKSDKEKEKALNEIIKVAKDHLCNTKPEQ